jgi:hypothetical protein
VTEECLGELGAVGGGAPAEAVDEGSMFRLGPWVTLRERGEGRAG